MCVCDLFKGTIDIPDYTTSIDRMVDEQDIERSGLSL
jgi:hypothetical protein